MTKGDRMKTGLTEYRLARWLKREFDPQHEDVEFLVDRLVAECLGVSMDFVCDRCGTEQRHSPANKKTALKHAMKQQRNRRAACHFEEEVREGG